MRYVVLLLAAGLLVGEANLAAAQEESPGACAAMVDGEVIVRLVAHYGFGDREQPANHYVYIGPAYVVRDQEVRVAYDWRPVCVEWYRKPVGGGSYYKLTQCGTKPKRRTDRVQPDLPPVDSCLITVEGAGDVFARGYYLHPDPETPNIRFVFDSEVVASESDTDWDFQAANPVAVQWFVRKYGTLIAYPEDWEIAKTCGTVPTTMPLVVDDPPLLIARR